MCCEHHCLFSITSPRVQNVSDFFLSPTWRLLESYFSTDKHKFMPFLKALEEPLQNRLIPTQLKSSQGQRKVKHLEVYKKLVNVYLEWQWTTAEEMLEIYGVLTGRAWLRSNRKWTRLHGHQNNPHLIVKLSKVI